MVVSAHAASITFNGSASTTGGTAPSINQTSASAISGSTAAPSGASYSSSLSQAANYGDLSFAFGASATCPVCDSSGATGSGSVSGYFAADDLTFTGLPGNTTGITLDIPYSISGTLSGSGNYYYGDLSFELDGNLIAFSVALSGPEINNKNPGVVYISSETVGSGSTISSWVAGSAFGASGVAAIPISGSQLTLGNDLTGNWAALSGSINGPGAAAIGGSISATYGGAYLAYADGSAVTGATFTADSGTDYAATPEPATFGTIAAGLVGLAGWMRKRAARTR